MARYSYYDDWFDSEDQGIQYTSSCAVNILKCESAETYDGYGLFDAEVGYTFDAGVTVVVGASNLTDETPDENKGAADGVGNRYSQWAPGGFNGRFTYVRLMYDF
jgi:iron complex outermembrane receptor protein